MATGAVAAAPSAAELAELSGSPAASGPSPGELAELGGQAPGMSAGEAALHKGAQGLTLGFSDEIRGGLSAAMQFLSNAPKAAYGTSKLTEGVADVYRAKRDEERKAQGQASLEHPIVSAVAEIGGGLLPSLVAPGAAVARGLIGGSSQLVRAAKAGATVGALTGLGESQADLTREGTAAQAVKDTLTGGVIGGAVGGTLSAAATGLKAAKGVVGKRIGQSLEKAAAKGQGGNVTGVAGAAVGGLLGGEDPGTAIRNAVVGYAAGKMAPKVIERLLRAYAKSAPAVQKQIDTQIAKAETSAAKEWGNKLPEDWRLNSIAPKTVPDARTLKGVDLNAEKGNVLDEAGYFRQTDPKTRERGYATIGGPRDPAAVLPKEDKVSNMEGLYKWAQEARERQAKVTPVGTYDEVIAGLNKKDTQETVARVAGNGPATADLGKNPNIARSSPPTFQDKPAGSLDEVKKLIGEDGRKNIPAEAKGTLEAMVNVVNSKAKGTTGLKHYPDSPSVAFQKYLGELPEATGKGDPENALKALRAGMETGKDPAPLLYQAHNAGVGDEAIMDAVGIRAAKKIEAPADSIRIINPKESQEKFRRKIGEGYRKQFREHAGPRPKIVKD